MFEVLSVILIVVGLSVLVVIHEAGHFFASKWFGLLVEEFGFGLPPRFWGKKIGETIYSFNWLPFGGFVKIYGERHADETSYADVQRSFSHQSIFKRALIIVAGVLMNFLLGWLLITIVFMVGIPQAVLVTDIKEGSIAALAGIQKGDRLVDFKLIPELLGAVEQNKGGEMILNVERGKEKLTINVIPRADVPEGEGNLGIFIVESGLPKTGFFRSFWDGLKTSLKMTGAIFVGIIDLVVGIFTDISILERFIGPVGIVNVAIQSTRLGVAHFLQLLALISLNLAVFNVIPIPALDGGRLFFLLIEKIKGKAINQRTEMIVNAAGFAFLLLLILAITVKDILTLL
ncbi:MAG: site-2 protease family protein [Candidatus Harrisonbacteria bacterium]|nr:site-2 protease family protein [Candidatus Harrisonbacteria bacterium]